MYPKSIQKLINLFSKFPTVGPRTASRFVFYLTKLSQAELEELRKNIKVCSFCFDAFEDSEESLCHICRNKSRNREFLCIIEKEADLESIEKIKKYNGLYFILGGTISLKRKKNIRIEELKQRIKDNDFKEIIIATNPTPEGEATGLFIERELKPFNIKTTHLGRGLPIGGELEYADPDTLSSSLESRK
jgi:recombination protein RecR